MTEDDEDYPYDEEEEPYNDWEQCRGCGANIFCEEHDIDCPYADDDEEDDE